MKKVLVYNIVLAMLLLSSCSDNDKTDFIDFSIAFTAETSSLLDLDTDKEITLTYSRAATETGTITINYSLDNATYGEDFTTTPSGVNGTITIPVAVGDLNSKIIFTKLKDAIEGTTKAVTFKITSFDQTEWVKGSIASSLLSFTPTAATSGVIDVLLGGPNEPNQVYIDLSTGQQKAVQRDTWEIGLYNGAENRVFLNSALLVSAAELEGITDLNTVTKGTVLTKALTLNSINPDFSPKQVTVTTVEELIEGLPLGYGQYSNHAEGYVFTDLQSGEINGTAFSAISTTAEENNVYIVGLGNAISTETPDSGSISTSGDHNGFMKVRVLTDGSSYTIQYATLDANTFSEITVNKDATKIVSAVSLSDSKEVDVQPATENWDINFTGVFSVNTSNGFGFVYSDYVLHNTLGNVSLYQQTLYTVDRDTKERTDYPIPSYADFTASDVDQSLLVNDDHSVIGSGWRNAFSSPPSVKDDRYFVLKDAAGNFYKIKFTALLSSEGERGNPQFIYEKL
ncbi:HmuY family protein [uncultured Maribacter sp.]|uniref:HmuY family protein n=1 Tax=uncultured Maribacter sp. TaxID=431308 RepID=UPI002627C00E|nr:HmuY family protein [uncultured Maribacter sp.]